MTTPAFPAKKRLLVSLLSIAVLSACGGGGGGSAASDQAVMDDQFLARGKGNSGTQPGNNGKGSKDGSTTPTSPTTDDTTTQPGPTTDTEAPLAPSTGTDTTAPSADTTTPTPAPEPAPAPPPTSQISSIVAGPAINLPGAITTVAIDSTASTSQANVPVTFGQVFKQGDVLSSEKLTGKLADGSAIPIQVDIKATHADGSLRHAIISTVLPSLPAGKSMSIGLTKTTGSTTTLTTPPTTLTNSGFTANVNITLGGEVYTASADALLKSNTVATWLSGSIVNEWHVSAPLTTAAGVAHPHLSARFAIRSYAGMNKARVDVTIENNWAYEPNPQNFTYDTEVIVGGKSTYMKSGLVHYHHARWRKLFWWGTEPEIHVKHNTIKIIGSQAVPNYDTRISVSSTGLNNLYTKWTNANTSPMGPGILTTTMPATGGRPDIGPLPQWAAMYILSMDERAKKVTLGVGDLAGSWPIHYRDKKTDRPVSLDDYPYMTQLGRPGDAINPKTGRSEAFPTCGGDCSTAPHNYQTDSAHQPSLAYLPYLITGDYYYLEELHFWANYNMWRANPYYREFEKGIMRWDQVRAQAWSLRTLGHAAYITPDNHSMKSYFADRIDYNLDWYNETYSDAQPNQLGVLDGSGKINYWSTIVYKTANGEATGIAPWQDDFFTWSTGHLAELGFNKANRLLIWKAKFPVGRLTAPGYCWIDGATYTLAIRPSSTSPIYSTFQEAYQATIRNIDGSPMTNSTGAQYIQQECGSQAQADWRTQKDKDNKAIRNPWLAGEMDGYSNAPDGYPSNMQAALAVSVDAGISNAEKAWSTFMGRALKPDYSSQPQWALVPRR